MHCGFVTIYLTWRLHCWRDQKSHIGVLLPKLYTCNPPVTWHCEGCTCTCINEFLIKKILGKLLLPFGYSDFISVSSLGFNMHDWSVRKCVLSLYHNIIREKHSFECAWYGPKEVLWGLKQNVTQMNFHYLYNLVIRLVDCGFMTQVKTSPFSIPAKEQKRVTE